MIVLAIAGYQDSGKTNSIRIVAECLLQKWDSKIDKISICDDPDIIIPDFRKYIPLKNGLKLGICSGGDDKYAIQQNFKFSQKYSCDIFIVAVRFKWGGIPQYFYDELGTQEDYLIALSPIHQPNVNYSPQMPNVAGNNFEKFHNLSAHNILWVLRHILQTKFQCSNDYLNII